jgi:hypothetical protein
MRREEYSELYEMVYTLVLVEQGFRNKAPAFRGVDPFAFVASASMRGDTGCAAPTCRLKKLDMLARFTALYADAVVLPVPIFNPDYVDYLKHPRTELQKVVFSLLRLRVLIREGLIRPKLMESHYCSACYEIHQRLVNTIRDAASVFADRSINAFKAHYEAPSSSPNRFGHVEIEGPSDFIEHGGMHRIPRNKKLLDEIGVSTEANCC